MSYLKFILIIFSFIFFSSCGSVEKAFNNQKKDSSDEFLVEKKSALIMPPDYNELPIPGESREKAGNEDEEIKSLIITNQETETVKIDNNVDASQNFENSILKKIKKN